MRTGAKVTGVADVNRTLRDSGPKVARALLRVTTFDIAKQAAVITQSHTPDNPKTAPPDLKTGIKPRRERGSRDRIEATVRVTNSRRNYFWWFLQQGTGPDHVAYGMFKQTLQEMRPGMTVTYYETFARKLVERMARERKRRG